MARIEVGVDQRNMDLYPNATVQSLAIHPADENVLLSGKQLSASKVLSWLFSRLRVFLYLSDPYEESFEYEHEVADYHTEVSDQFRCFHY